MIPRFLLTGGRRAGRTILAQDLARHSASHASASAASATPSPRPEPGSVTAEQDLAIHAMEFVRLRYLHDAQPDRNWVLERCVRFLMALGYISQERAATIAAQAMGEFESTRAGVSFDANRCTSYVVFLNDPSCGAVRAISAADLLRLLHRSAASPAA